MVTLIARPEVLNFSQNPVVYKFRTDTPIDTAGLAIEVALYFAGLDGDFEQVFFQPLYPDSNGYVTFQPQAVLNSFLEYVPPIPGDKAVALMASQSGRFYVEYREITVVSSVVDWQSDHEHVRYVIKGGLAYERWSPSGFWGFLYANRFYLTWQASGRLCGANETMYLYFLLTEAVSELAAKVKVVYRDRSEKEVVLPFRSQQKYGIYAVPTGLQQLGIASDKPIYYYEVAVWSDSTVIAAPYRYHVDNRINYNDTQFNYVNSLGGFDSVRVLGVTESELTRDLQLAGSAVSPFYNDRVLPAHTIVQSIKTGLNFKGDVGFLGKKEQHYLLDLFASRNVFELRYGRWMPVVITSKGVPQPKSDDMLFSLPVEWQQGWVNNKFTPNFAGV